LVTQELAKKPERLWDVVAEILRGTAAQKNAISA
jgi:hypothetical protein